VSGHISVCAEYHISVGQGGPPLFKCKDAHTLSSDAHPAGPVLVLVAKVGDH